MSTAAMPPAEPRGRLEAIDLLRGLVMVLMALDHVRDFFHAGVFRYDPLDPATTTVLLYATRWVTHLCAPTFVFLAGVSAYLQCARGKPVAGLSRFLLTRGLWLVFLELTVLSFGWSFGFPYVPFLQVMWAIGWAMVALAGLVWLPAGAVLAIGLGVVAGHNLLDAVTPQQFGNFSALWVVLHQVGPLVLGGTPVGLSTYPLLPWIGVMATGYGMGALFLQPPGHRDRLWLILGGGMLLLFVALRWLNGYGDSDHWSAQDDLARTLMSFMRVSKYPPSLLFVLVTLGIALLLLPLLARLRGPVRQLLAVFGSVPLFFYVLHIYLAHGLAIAANAVAGRDASGLFNYLLNAFTAPERLQGLGFSLAGVYLAWAAVLALLYLPCRWWAKVKARRREWWMAYL